MTKQFTDLVERGPHGATCPWRDCAEKDGPPSAPTRFPPSSALAGRGSLSPQCATARRRELGREEKPCDSHNVVDHGADIGRSPPRLQLLAATASSLPPC